MGSVKQNRAKEDNFNDLGSVIQGFREAMASYGIETDDQIIPDGQVRRFHISGHKRGSKNGAFTLFCDSKPGGWFLDFKSGKSSTWSQSGKAHFSREDQRRIKASRAIFADCVFQANVTSDFK